MHMIDLAGRVAIVTGAGGGLGRQHALLLARRGARVVVNDLGAGADAVAAEIVAAGGQARAVQCSVTDADAVQAMVDGVVADWGRVDILVNNAGILRDKSFAKLDLADFRAVVDVQPDAIRAPFKPASDAAACGQSGNGPVWVTAVTSFTTRNSSTTSRTCGTTSADGPERCATSPELGQQRRVARHGGHRPGHRRGRLRHDVVGLVRSRGLGEPRRVQ